MHVQATSTALSLTVQEIKGEARILDTDLAAALGMERPTNVRTRIKGMLIDLKKLGPCITTVHDHPTVAGRTVTAYYLNEEQATLLVMAIKTLKAREVKLQIVRVFTAWRRGQLQPVQPDGSGSAGLASSSSRQRRTTAARSGIE